MKLPTIGFIGLGAMGGRMAKNLIKAGYPLVGFDVRPEAIEACVQAGGKGCASISEAVQQSEIVLTSLVAHIYQKVAESDLIPNARSGQIFIDHSTVPAPEARRIACAFAEKGAVALDVPVSGWITGAENGQLSMFVGGDEVTAKKCWPIFEVLGNPQKIIYGGEAGKGQVLKVIQQLKGRLLDAARLEILAFGHREGLGWDQILKALGTEANADEAYAKLYRKIAAGQGDELGCLFGEWSYYLQEARVQGIPMPVLESLYRFCESGPKVNKDEQGRSGPSVWKELTTRKGPAIT